MLLHDVNPSSFQQTEGDALAKPLSCRARSKYIPFRKLPFAQEPAASAQKRLMFFDVGPLIDRSDAHISTQQSIHMRTAEGLLHFQHGIRRRKVL
jgi:hypothetical protein